MTIRKELIDNLIASSGGSLIGPDGLVKRINQGAGETVKRTLTGRR